MKGQSDLPVPQIILKAVDHWVLRAPFNPVVLMPTFNNARTIAAIVAAVCDLSLSVIVVDDGCTDETKKMLAPLAEKIQTVKHPHNRGRQSRRPAHWFFLPPLCARPGFTHAITIDTDGQLDPAQIPQFIERSRQHPQALVIGVRDESKADYPCRSCWSARASPICSCNWKAA